MTDNVVDLHPSRAAQGKLIWVCNCGCSTHYAHADGQLECAHCGAMGDGSGSEWREQLPEPTTVHPVSTGPDEKRVVSLGDTSAALKRMLRRAEDDRDNLAFVLIYRRGGEVGVWGDKIEGDEQSTWFDRRCADAKELLAKAKT